MTLSHNLKRLAEEVTGDNPEWVALKDQIMAALVLVHDDEPHAISFIHHLLTTGSPEALAETREEVRSMLGEITDAYVKLGNNWKQGCRHLIGSRMVEELMQTWSIYQLEAEFPSGQSRYALARKTSWAYHSIDSAKLNLTSYPVNYELWRGVAALGVSGASNAVHSKTERTEFVKYAGRHHDIKAVLEVAQERNTIDPALIEYLIRQSGNHNPLGPGAL